MAYWLMKQEPSEWGWDDLVAEGETYWDGVRNHQAAANIRKMKKDDRVFFCHSVDEKAIVDVMQVTREAYPDPTAEAGTPWVVVDVKPLKPVEEPGDLGGDQTGRPLRRSRPGAPVQAFRHAGRRQAPEKSLPDVRHQGDGEEKTEPSGGAGRRPWRPTRAVFIGPRPWRSATGATTIKQTRFWKNDDLGRRAGRSLLGQRAHDCQAGKSRRCHDNAAADVVLLGLFGVCVLHWQRKPAPCRFAQPGLHPRL